MAIFFQLCMLEMCWTKDFQGRVPSNSKGFHTDLPKCPVSNSTSWYGIKSLGSPIWDTSDLRQSFYEMTSQWTTIPCVSLRFVCHCSVKIPTGESFTIQQKGEGHTRQFTGKNALASCKSPLSLQCNRQLQNSLRNQQKGQTGFRKYVAKRTEPHQTKTQSYIVLYWIWCSIMQPSAF